MGLFDNLKNKVDQAAKKAMNNIGNKTEEIVFSALPDDVAGLYTIIDYIAVNCYCASIGCANTYFTTRYSSI